MNKTQNISGKNIALYCGRKQFNPSDSFVALPTTYRVFDTVFPSLDYIEANPKQSLSLTTCLTNAPHYPITDNGGLAELNSRADAKSVILSKLIGLL
jgi:hypothetical protein